MLKLGTYEFSGVYRKRSDCNGPPKSRRICMGKTALTTQSRFVFRWIEKRVKLSWRMAEITPWDR